MNKQKILALVSEIKNPVSDKTLGQEDRIIEVHSTDHAVTVVFARDEIPTPEKKMIESEILNILSKEYELDCITILSQSNNDKAQDECCSAHSGHSCGHGHDHHDHGDHHHHHDHDHSGHSCGHGNKNESKQASVNVGHSGLPEKRKLSNVKKIIAVSSGKGGVGKSTVAVNLAISLTRLGYKVGLIDSDIYGPSIPMLMGQREASPMATEDNRIIPVSAHGIQFMSFGFFINEEDPVIWRGPMLGGILNQFLFDVEWGELDYLLIDMPPGTGDMQLSLAQNLDFFGAIIVSTPQDVSLLDSYKGVSMFQKVGVRVLGMVENMSSFICEHGTEYFIFGNGGVEKCCFERAIPFLGSVPFEIELRESSDRGVPYMTNNEFEGRRVWKAYSGMAQTLDSLK